MRTRLTRADIYELLEDPSDDRRVQLARGVGERALAPALEPGERKLAYEILRLMAADVAEAVRLALVETVKADPNLPNDLAMTLAKVVDAVAVPLVEASPVFSEHDLIELVRGARRSLQMAVARRAEVSEPVSAAIVDFGDGGVVAALARNTGARFDPHVLERMINNVANDNRDVADALGTRNDLPFEYAERLIHLVTEDLAESIVMRYGAGHQAAGNKTAARQAVDAAVRRAGERAMVDALAKAGGRKDVHALVDRLYAEDRLTGSLLLRAALTGEMVLFEAGLAKRAGVEVTKAWVLIHDEGELGLPALLERARLPRNYLPALRAAIAAYHELEASESAGDRQAFRTRMIERVLTLCDTIQSSDAEYLLAKLDQLSVEAATEAA